MRVVIETEDFDDEEALKTHLRHIQEDSDEIAAQSPEDYWPGYGPLSLGTSRVALGAKIIGVLHTDEIHALSEDWYRIEPLPEGK